MKSNEQQLDICVDKFDCYHRDKCTLPLKDSEPNVSESHLRTNIDYFQQFRILVQNCALSSKIAICQLLTSIDSIIYRGSSSDGRSQVWSIRLFYFFGLSLSLSWVPLWVCLSASILCVCVSASMLCVIVSVSMHLRLCVCVHIVRLCVCVSWVPLLLLPPSSAKSLYSQQWLQ